MERRISGLALAGLPVCWVLVLGGCGRQVAQQPTEQPTQQRAQPSSPPKPALKQAPPTPIAEKKEELGQQSWDPQWDVIVEKALSPDMLSPRVARGEDPTARRVKSRGEARLPARDEGHPRRGLAGRARAAHGAAPSRANEGGENVRRNFLCSRIGERGTQRRGRQVATRPRRRAPSRS